MKNITLTLFAILTLSLNCFACEKHSPFMKEAWARKAAAESNSAVYLDIENDLDIDDELIGVSTNIADITSIHKTVIDKGISQMVHIDRLIVPSKNKVQLKPKGIHIMLMKLKRSLKSGEEFEVSLNFKNAGLKNCKVVVK
jgi:periplasmic copper chaperone A